MLGWFPNWPAPMCFSFFLRVFSLRFFNRRRQYAVAATSEELWMVLESHHRSPGFPGRGLPRPRSSFAGQAAQLAHGPWLFSFSFWLWILPRCVGCETLTPRVFRRVQCRRHRPWCLSAIEGVLLGDERLSGPENVGRLRVQSV